MMMVGGRHRRKTDVSSGRRHSFSSFESENVTVFWVKRNAAQCDAMRTFWIRGRYRILNCLGI